MALSFDDVIENDHLNIITSKEFGSVCVNNTTGQTFDIVKTDAFILVDAEGLPIVEDKPMFNTSKNFLLNDVLTPLSLTQFDDLTIDSRDFIVRDIRQDGIGGLDVYLKDKSNV